MGEKRITSHIHFLVNNLSYPKADGRKSVLELLNQIILKFPNEVLMKLSNLLFLALTLRLANDPDPTCRGMVSELLVNLFQCLTTKNSQRSRKSSQRSGPLGVFFGNTKKWLQDTEGKKKSLQLAGVQVAGILARAVGSGFQAYAGDIIPLLIDIAVHAFERNSKQRNADINTQTNNSIDENGDSEAWNLAHHTVVALTRALKASPRHTAKSALKSSGIPLATIAANGLRFPHVWVRTACARLLGQCLAVRSEAVDEKSTDWIRETALSCCAGFVTDELITTTLGEQLAKNILFLATDQPDSDIIQAIAKRLGGIARKSKPKGISAMNLVSISGEEKEPGWIIRRRSIIKVFGALVAKLEAERSIPLLSIILRPMIMATEDTPSSKNDNAPLKQLAQQVLDLIQKKVGDDHFATAYTQVRGEIMGKRAERAKRRKLEVVQDPQGAARRKRQRTQKKIVAQKRQKAVRKAIRSGELPVARKRCQSRQKKRRV
uniref:U3 small nucleolar RNA-associated protein 20 C-terminal domain-containing protein n=1 Tax=Amorphochlora amoebiformis TaxID=1561963 RepID=A0A7S0DKT2_9EUKA